MKAANAFLANVAPSGTKPSVAQRVAALTKPSNFLNIAVGTLFGQIEGGTSVAKTSEFSRYSRKYFYTVLQLCLIRINPYIPVVIAQVHGHYQPQQ